MRNKKRREKKETETEKSHEADDSGGAGTYRERVAEVGRATWNTVRRTLRQCSCKTKHVLSDLSVPETKDQNRSHVDAPVLRAR